MIPQPPSEVADVDLASAMRGLADKLFVGSERYREQQWRADRQGADPQILEFEKRFVARMAKLDIPVFAHEMVRSVARQNELYVKGFSRARGGQSPHQIGMAVDIIHSLKAWKLTDRQWSIFGHAGKEIAKQAGIPITWGGDFKSLYDPAHWEISGWKQKGIENK